MTLVSPGMILDLPWDAVGVSSGGSDVYNGMILVLPWDDFGVGVTLV